jgi:hypothetical protein
VTSIIQPELLLTAGFIYEDKSRKQLFTNAFNYCIGVTIKANKYSILAISLQFKKYANILETGNK